MIVTQNINFASSLTIKIYSQHGGLQVNYHWASEARLRAFKEILIRGHAVLIQLLRKCKAFYAIVSKNPLQWGTFVISLAALLLSFCNQHKINKNDSIVKEININKEIQEIVDLIAGEKNSSNLPEEIRDHNKYKQTQIKRKLDNLLIVYPSNPRIILIYSLWWAMKGNPQMEEEYIKKALDIDPNYAAAHNELGLVYMKKGNNEDAIVEFEKTIKLDPNHPEPYVNVANLYFKDKKYDKALAFYTEANKIDGDFKEVHIGLFNIHYIKGEKDEAFRECKEAFSLDPKYDLAKECMQKYQQNK